MYVYAYIINQMLTTTFDTCIVHSCLTYMLLGQAQHLLCTIAGRHFTAPRHWPHLRSPPPPPLWAGAARRHVQFIDELTWWTAVRCGAKGNRSTVPGTRAHSPHDHSSIEWDYWASTARFLISSPFACRRWRSIKFAHIWHTHKWDARRNA